MIHSGETPPAGPAVVMGLDVAGYGLVRSLAREGIPLTGMWRNDTEAARFSRYSEAVAVSPDTDEAWGRALVQAAGDRDRPTLFPSNDRYVDLVIRYQDDLKDIARFHWVAPEQLETVLDKARMHEVCKRIGLSLPRTCSPHGPDLAREAEAFVYPCLVKPRTTYRCSLPGRTKAIVCRTPEDLLATYERLPALRGTTLWQEIIEGGDDAIYQATALMTRNGALGAMACVRKIRQYRPSYGITSFGITDWQEEVVTQTTRLLGALRWRGLASVEFKRSSRDGRYYFIEMNPRLPWYNGLFRDAGINLPFLTHLDLMERPLPVVQQTDGIAWMSFSADLSSFWERWTAGTLSLTDWLPQLGLPASFAWYDPTDPGPIVATTARLSGLGWQELQRRLADGPAA